MKKLPISLALALALALASIGTAFGHVHAITPLTCLSTDNAAKSGAFDAQGAPIDGLIPNVVGNANLEPFTLGRDAAPCEE